jgi:HAD superfamily hydrolase (TIGR01459 family)
MGNWALVEFVETLDEVGARYSAILCDVWGVVHNGVTPYPGACEALARARAKGIAVVLITNSPRPRDGVETQLKAIGCRPDAWDSVVTSGDVTRELIAEGPRRVFHIGPERDQPIFDGLDVELTEESEAATVVCTGLFDDEAETPDDYADLLRRLRSRNLPFVCANPDLVVERGHRMIFCAGSIAREYSLLGGRTLIAGKPFKPIYDAALEVAGEALGRTLEKSEALAIGDGMLTDIKGATDNGFDVLYVSGGVHARDYGDPLDPDRDQLLAFLASHGERPVASIPRLR